MPVRYYLGLLALAVAIPLIGLAFLAVEAPAWQVRWPLLAGGIGWIALSLAVAWLIASRLAAGIELLQSTAIAMGEEQPVQPHATGVRELDEVVSAFAGASSRMRARARDRFQAEEALARRINELAALYEFTDKRFYAKSLTDIYDAALDAILSTLRCTRASILLFDEAGVMRFVAWRGLSDDYRKAVEGHSPWTPDARDPQPICVGDVETADFPQSLRATLRAERIGALAFIPVVADGKLVGKFMTYYPSRHVFTDADVDLAVAIARHLGFSVEGMRAEEARRRAEEELRKNEERERARAAELQAIMEAVPAVIWIARDPDCLAITGNRTSYEFLRLPAGNASLSANEAERPTHFDVLGDGRVLATQELPVQRAARGEEVRNVEAEVRFNDGTSRHLLGNATPLRDAEGRPYGAVGAFVDITERKRAESQRDLLLAELSHRVKNTLATVIAIAHQSFARGRPLEEARQSFDDRILALAQTHSRLAEANWSGVSLETIVRDETAPYHNGGNVHISGPSITLNPKCALTLGMAFHELTTNAAKHGALATKHGSVEVAWDTPAEGQIRISWRESGGPSVAPPQHSGFGRMLLEQVLSADLHGKVQLDFREAGLQCAIAFPFRRNCLA